MSVIVLKFGGTSIANVDRIKSVAQRIAKEISLGNQVAVVVSAMAGVTNQLIGWVYDSVPHNPDPFEYDVVVSTGEQITSGLLALVLQGMNISARSWLGWQVPILTDDVHGKAQKITISPSLILSSLNQGQVAIVAGFQGVDSQQRITTLGRGGSDTTAVALAHALKAERCDIYTDVEGVFTADPRIVSKASKIPKIAYPEMLELAWQGAKVLQPHSVELAMHHKVRLQVLSSFSEESGTWVVGEEELEKRPLITGIASNCNTAKIEIKGVPGQLNIEELICQPLEKAHIHIDMWAEIPSLEEGVIDVVFTTSREDIPHVKALIADLQEDLNFPSIYIGTEVAKVAVVGMGVTYSKDLTHIMLQALAAKGIETQMVRHSDIKISALVADSRADEALQILHTAFGLDQVTPTHLKIA
jgi:aspartate kinase